MFQKCCLAFGLTADGQIHESVSAPNSCISCPINFLGRDKTGPRPFSCLLLAKQAMIRLPLIPRVICNKCRRIPVCLRVSSSFPLFRRLHQPASRPALKTPSAVASVQTITTARHSLSETPVSSEKESGSSLSSQPLSEFIKAMRYAAGIRLPKNKTEQRLINLLSLNPKPASVLEDFQSDPSKHAEEGEDECILSMLAILEVEPDLIWLRACLETARKRGFSKLNIMFSIMMRGALMCGDPLSCQHYFNEMRALGLNPGVSAYSSLLLSYEMREDYQGAVSVLDLISKLPTPSADILCLALSISIELKAFPQALCILELLWARGQLQQAHRELKQPPTLLFMRQYLLNHGSDDEIKAFALLCRKHQAPAYFIELPDALQTLFNSDRRHLSHLWYAELMKPWNLALSLSQIEQLIRLCDTNQLRQLIDYIELARTSAGDVGISFINAVISVLSRTETAAKDLTQYRQMIRSSGLKPTAETYSHLLSGFVRCRKPDDVASVLEEMLTQSQHVNAIDPETIRSAIILLDGSKNNKFSALVKRLRDQYPDLSSSITPPHSVSSH